MAITSQCCPSGSTLPPVLFDICKVIEKNFGYKPNLIMDCTYEWTDITDPTEWETAYAAGHIQCMPPSRVLVNPPTEQTYIWEDCNKSEIAYDGQYVLDITSPWIMADKSDGRYWSDFKKSANINNLILRECDGCFILPEEQIEAIEAGNVSGSGWGFPYSVPQTPHKQNTNGLFEWKTQAKFAYNGVLQGIDLAGVNSVLCC